MQQQLARLPAPHAIDQHHVLARIPVVAVVRRELVVPLALAGVGIERDDRVAEQIVELAARRPIDLRRRDCRRSSTPVFSSGSYEPVSHVGPPPIFQLSPFHVSLPNSPGPGTV